MKLFLIRHGATKGNREKRYVGSTDEALLGETVDELMDYRRQKEEMLSQVEMVVTSPLVRCRQTADILFPEKSQCIVEAFRECDFGQFEYCNFQELNGNPFYQRFVDSFGECGFPGGEDRNSFQKRCVEGFEELMRKEVFCQLSCAVMVVHGGTIMALMDQYSVPHRDYYEWQIGNGTGYVTEVVRDLKNGLWQFTKIEKI